MTLRPLLALTLGALLLGGCAQGPGYDYSNFKESRPTSILVLPPVNHSPDIKAGPSLQSTALRSPMVCRITATC